MSSLNLVGRLFGPPIGSTTYCENCGISPKYQNHNYCGKTCAAEAERKNSAAQTASSRGPPASVARQGRLASSASVGSYASPASNSCENCFARAKSREPDEDGTVITHPYCGIRCYQASQRTFSPASTIPAPAAAFAGQESLALRIERTSTPIGHKISLMMQERWKSSESQIPKLKAIYRIDLPGHVYRRFDLALQMNDGCPVTTTYYGGVAMCSLADDTNPTPCASESCGLCDALRSSFGNLLHGSSCSNGDYGPGLYTYSNPASAHRATVTSDTLQPQRSNFALIQCRVVAKADSLPSSNSYAGFVDDEGVVFCAQSTAIIPTHVLICNTPVQPKASQHAIPINTNPVPLGSAPSTNTQGQHQPTTDSAIPGSLQPVPTNAPNLTGRLASTSYESSRGGPQNAMRQSFYPLAGHANDDTGPDDGLISNAAAANKYMKRSRDLGSRMDDDDAFGPLKPDENLAKRMEQQDRFDEEDDDFGPLKPDENLAKRTEQQERFDKEDEDDFDDLPDHPPGYHKPPPKRGPKPIFFYEETEKYYEFTNFAPYPVVFRGKEYPTSEHLFQARKFLDHKPLLAEHIRLHSDRPRVAVNEASRLAPETRLDWKEKCIEIMEEILELKFTQHNKLRRLLLETGERYLVLNARQDDDFWGNGADGNGRNELGKAVMRLRATLRDREKEALANPKGKGKYRR